MQLHLTPSELRELTKTPVVQVGWLLDLPSRASRVFVPFGIDPKKVSIESGEVEGNPIPCYIPADKA